MYIYIYLHIHIQISTVRWVVERREDWGRLLSSFVTQGIIRLIIIRHPNLLLLLRALGDK